MNLNQNSYTIDFYAQTMTSPLQMRQCFGIQGNKWNTIKVETLEDRIHYFINDINCGYLFNKDRSALEKVNVYASSNFYNPPNAKLRHLIFTQITEQPTNQLSTSYVPSNFPSL